MPRKRNWFWIKPIAHPDEGLQWIRVPAQVTELPRPVVLVNGGFDILHSGHAKILAIARHKARNGSVVCAMDSDARVRAAKGPGRPVMSWIERAVALQYQPVDFLVEIETDKDIKRLIETLRPDLRVQGSEYMKTVSKYPGVPKAFLARRGMSTSEIISRCRRVPE